MASLSLSLHASVSTSASSAGSRAATPIKASCVRSKVTCSFPSIGATSSPSSSTGLSLMAPKPKNLVVASGLTGFIWVVDSYTIRAVGSIDKLKQQEHWVADEEPGGGQQADGVCLGGLLHHQGVGQHRQATGSARYLVWM